MDEAKSTRPVRALLLKGAKRSAVNNEGQRSIELVRESLPENMKAELIQMLEEPKYIECFMVKTPMVKLRRNHKTQMLFITLFIVLVCAQIFIIVPSKSIFCFNFLYRSKIQTLCLRNFCTLLHPYNFIYFCFGDRPGIPQTRIPI